MGWRIRGSARHGGSANGASRGRPYHVDRSERRMATRLGARVYACRCCQDLDRARWWKWGCIRLGDATSGRFQAVTIITAAISLNPAVPDTIDTLIKRNLHEVFGERDAKKRRKAIAQLWTEDCVFIDHSGKSHGRYELDRAVAALHQRLPGYVFSELRPVDLLHESGRLAWSYGRPGQEPIKGVDVVLVRNGHISLMLTFLDEVPAKL